MIFPDIPVKALSVMQPWSWLIVTRHKPIENRSWRTRYRGPVAIHAGKKIDEYCAADLKRLRHPTTYVSRDFSPPPVFERGGIVGVADIVDCVGECSRPPP